MDNKKLVEKWFEEVWNQLNSDTIFEMFSKNAMADGLGARSFVGPEEFKKFHENVCMLLDDVKITIDDMIAEGTKVSALATCRAIARNTRKPVILYGSSYFEFKDGMIVSIYNHWDFIDLFEQMRLLPPGTIIKGMKGDKIA